MEQNLKKTAPTLRYNINAKLHLLTATARSNAKKKILFQTGVAKSTFSRWCNLTNLDNADIPATALLKIADILNVDLKDLINE